MRTLLLSLAPLLTLALSCSDDTVAPPADASGDRPVAGLDRGVAAEVSVSREAGHRPDGASREAGTGEAGVKADGGASTPCGAATCNTATHVCVEKSPVGPGVTFTCLPVPPGCETNRTCACLKSALCQGAYNVCTDGSAFNTIHCECPLCQ